MKVNASKFFTPYKINVTLNVIKHPLELIPLNETRTLVDAATNLDNETKQIMSLFQNKVAS